MRRVASVVMCAAMLTACGTVAVDPGSDSTSSSQPGAPTTSAAPTTTHVVAPVTTAPPQDTTTTGQPSTTVATTGPTTVAAKLTVAPWFFVDEPGHPARTGPFLLPVSREVAHTVAVGRASLEQLFAGPSIGEIGATPALSTAIPTGVEVLGLTITEGIAVVDLSEEFGGTDDSAVVAQRMAQVVFTLTSIPHVDEVLFRQEGSAIAAQTSEGQLVDRPVLKADYLDFAAAITVESPSYGGEAGSPLHVTGFAAVFEATFSYVLADGNGSIIAEGTAMTTNGTGWGGFDFEIDYDVDREQTGALIVFAYSAKDGSQIDVREYPVILAP